MSIFGALRKKRPATPFCTAVVPAAGSSTRMEGQDKLLLELGDRPVLVRTLEALEDCPLIHEVVVVTREDLVVPVSRLCREHGLTKVTKVVTGGATRTAPSSPRRCWRRSSARRRSAARRRRRCR